MDKIIEYETREEMFLHTVPKNKIGCEVGVCRGLNAVSLYHICKPSKLFLVDPFRPEQPLKDVNAIPQTFIEYRTDDFYDQVNHLFLKEIEHDKVEIVRESSIQFLKLIPDESLDWIYLDAFHVYNHIKLEINHSLRKVKKGGLIMGHDFTTHAPWRSGVIRATIEACQENKMRMIAITAEPLASFACRVL